MSDKTEHTALKWTIGIVAFVIYIAVDRGVILSDGAGFDSVEREWVMSTGQQWVMIIWTIAVIVGTIKVYKAIVKN